MTAQNGTNGDAKNIYPSVRAQGSGYIAIIISVLPALMY